SRPRSADHRDLHSFPTRRSSDLRDVIWQLSGQDGKIYGEAQFDLLNEKAFNWQVPLVQNNATPEMVENAKATNADAKAFLFWARDRKSTRLNSSHVKISYAVFCL